MSYVAYPLRFSIAALALFAFACGPSQTEAEDPDDAGDADSEDQVFDEYEAIEIGGTLHRPLGMMTPPDLDISGPQRSQAWQQGNQQYNEDDLEGALESYAELVELDPDDVPSYVNTWRGFLYLRAHRNDEAADIAKAYELPAPASDEEGEEEESGADGDDTLRGHEAYVAAWSAFRQGELERARDFILISGQRWPSPEGQRAVVDDIVLMTARAATPVADAHELVREIVGEDIEQQYVLLFRIHEQYVFAGEYGLASEMLDYIRDDLLGEGDLPAADAVGFRYRQSDYQFRIGEPEKAAQFSMEAYEALEACGDDCDESISSEVTRRLADLGRIFHTVYATSLDEAYFEPAKSLYEMYLGIDGQEDSEEVAEYLDNLERTKKNASPEQGRHDPNVMGNVLNAQQESIQACYEMALGWNPELSGQFVASIKVGETGEVTEVSTTPGADDEELGDVVGCVTERVANWSFPARTFPGTTTIEQTFNVTTELDPVEDAPAEGPGEASVGAPDSDTAEG